MLPSPPLKHKRIRARRLFRGQTRLIGPPSLAFDLGDSSPGGIPWTISSLLRLKSHNARARKLAYLRCLMDITVSGYNALFLSLSLSLSLSCSLPFSMYMCG